MKVDFYHLSRREQDAGLVSLVAKIFSLKKRAVLLCEDEAEANRLDDLLWTKKATSFWAHGIAGNENDQNQPFLISTEITDKNNPEIIMLFNLKKYPTDFGDYEKILVPFNGDDDKILSEARKEYAVFKEKKAEISYWKREENKWQKKI